MPLTAKGSEILAKMKKEYGETKGEEVFYASRNAGKISGVDSVPEELERAFTKFMEEEKKEKEHASDTLAMDLYDVDFGPRSNRKHDENGYLHVRSHISKATVNPYRGDEIPDFEALGLDRDRIYHLLRDPEELARAAPTFNNLPILTDHKAQSAENPWKSGRVGTTGTDTSFVHPYLDTTMAIWDAEPQAGIDTGQKRQLSASYRYRADMVPGVYEGTPYDGVMRDIRGNHVALVEAGRAGPDVLVGDRAIKGDPVMAAVRLTRKGLVVEGVVRGFLAARKLAMDAAARDAIRSSLDGVTGANWPQRKPAVIAAVHSVGARGGLAFDAQLADIRLALDEVDGEEKDAKDENLTDVSGLDEKETEEEEKERKERRAEDRSKGRDCAADEDPETEEEREHRKEARDRRAKDKRMGKDASEEEREEAKKEHKAEDRRAWDRRMSARDKRPAMDRHAMDTAIAAAEKRAEDRTIARMRSISEAERAVQPIVGTLAVAMDSAEDIYRYALQQAGEDVTGVPPGAYRRMVEMLIRHRFSAGGTRTLAHDSGAASGFEAFEKLAMGA
jgi:uncharacterized protein